MDVQGQGSGRILDVPGQEGLEIYRPLHRLFHIESSYDLEIFLLPVQHEILCHLSFNRKFISPA